MKSLKPLHHFGPEKFLVPFLPDLDIGELVSLDVDLESRPGLDLQERHAISDRQDLVRHY